MARTPYPESGVTHATQTKKPPKKIRVPSHRYHRASGQGVVTLAGKDHYTGKWQDENTPSPASEQRYSKLIAEWLGNNRQPLKPPKRRDAEDDDDGLTVAELCAHYDHWAQKNYQKDGAPTQEPKLVHAALKPVVERFGALAVEQFGPNCLRIVRDEYVAAGYVRNTVNDFVRRVRQAFRWGVSRELIRPEAAFALSTVEPLKAGQEGVGESKPVTLPPADWLDKVLPFVKEPVRSMLQLQRLTAMRAGEVRQMKPAMIDRKGKVWIYSPRRFKTQHHAGKSRRIPLGPQAQALLTPFLADCKPEQHVFRWTTWAPYKRTSKKEKTTDAVPKKTRKVGQPVDAVEYSHQLYRACRRAKLPYFRPHILRHMKLTELREQYGLDHAAAAAGHSTITMTQHYAKLNEQRAVQAALETG